MRDFGYREDDREEEIRCLLYELEGLSLNDVEQVLKQEIKTSTSACEAYDMSIYIMKYWSARKFAMLTPKLRNKVLEDWDDYCAPVYREIEVHDSK